MARSVYTFPYKTKFIEEGRLVDPRITIEVEMIHGWQPIKFLVDSGADVTSLPLTAYAHSFTFHKKESQKVMIGGIEGSGVGAYPFRFTCRLNSSVFRLRSYFIESHVDPLLGRLDFWDLFSIQFDNKKSHTILLSIPTK